jgi:hypothetical protein
MRHVLLVLAITALTVSALAVASYAQCAAGTVCAPAPATTTVCPAPCPTCPPLGEQKWTANLTSLPSVACPTATGRADFQLNSEGTAVRYWVYVDNASDVNGAQIRLVQPGASASDVATAPVVATLYRGTTSGCSSGRLSRGDITACDLTGPLAGQPLSALAIALTDCTAVVTVTTCQNPGGEIAGLSAPTTGQTVACYTGEMAQCNAGLNAACCEVACVPAVTCAPPCPTVAAAPAPCPTPPTCPSGTMGCCPTPAPKAETAWLTPPWTPPAKTSACCPPVTVACAPAPTVTCPPVQTVDMRPYWKANLSAMPPTCPSGSGGTAEFWLGPGGQSVQYAVNGEKISRYSAVQIRLLPSAESKCDLAGAPVVATLHCQQPRKDIYSGGLASGSVCSSELVGPLAGKPVSALVEALNDGTAVVAVETAQNPCGEVAGIPENCTGRAVA